MNTNDFHAKIMAELAEIKNLLASHNSSTPSTKEKKPRKPRDPDAPPNPWIVFTGRVRTALKAAGKPAGKECQQFASYLKTEFPDDAYSMDENEIMAAHADWTPPPPKPKPEAAATEAEPKPKPKRTLSEEQKAKMAAGRKAAAERRKAEKAAAEAANSSAEKEVVETVPTPIAGPKQPANVVKPTPTLKAFPFKGKKMLWDPESNGVWLSDNGVKGAWQGILAKDKKSIDATASDYTA